MTERETIIKEMEKEGERKEGREGGRERERERERETGGRVVPHTHTHTHHTETCTYMYTQHVQKNTSSPTNQNNIDILIFL